VKGASRDGRGVPLFVLLGGRGGGTWEWGAGVVESGGGAGAGGAGAWGSGPRVYGLLEGKVKAVAVFVEGACDGYGIVRVGLDGGVVEVCVKDGVSAWRDGAEREGEARGKGEGGAGDGDRGDLHVVGESGAVVVDCDGGEESIGGFNAGSTDAGRELGGGFAATPKEQEKKEEQEEENNKELDETFEVQESTSEIGAADRGPVETPAPGEETLSQFANNIPTPRRAQRKVAGEWQKKFRHGATRGTNLS
jgi:hypothetical protein